MLKMGTYLLSGPREVWPARQRPFVEADAAAAVGGEALSDRTSIFVEVDEDTGVARTRTDRV